MGGLAHVAGVVDGDAGQVRLYQDGTLRDTARIDGRLDEVGDASNWLGRSQLPGGPVPFRGTLRELRICDEAFDDAQIASSFQAGADARP